MKKNITFKNALQNIIVQYVILAFLINMVLEIMNRRSLIACLGFLVTSPIVFLYNTIIVFLTLSLGLLMKRRIFATSVIGLIWMILGTTNCIILGFRSTPFSAIDTIMIKNALELFNLYFTPIEIILLVASFSGITIGLIVLWRRAPKLQKRTCFLKYCCMIVVLFLTELIFTNVNIKANILSSNFENLSYAYKNYGFAYCFTNSIVDVGISKPANYSEEIISEITEPMSTPKQENPSWNPPSSTQPNIIVIQLESFFDVNYINDVTFSENPIPNFTNLKENFTSGFLTVPSIGAGTANTEFEVLTGMSTAFFGAGEYPFKTILTETTCESMAYLLSSQGYSTHGIHNNDGTFYSRNQVYANLGFDSFTPIEYMYNVENNPRGWAKDNCLPEEIFKCIDSSQKSDFVFTVSVQGHGRYPSEPIDDTQTITITSGNQTKKTELEYYVNQIHQMDQMIGSLIDQIVESGEPTVLLMYGDHLPTIGLSEKRLGNANMYQTEYLIWDNIGLKKQDEDLYSYQLSTKLFQELELPLGIMQEYHVEYKDKEEYHKDMEILEYDLLYGDQYTYSNGMTAYEPSNMQLGIDTISIQSITKAEDAEKSYYINGENFNNYTLVFVNEKRANTEVISESKLKITDVTLKDGDRVTTAQVGDDHIPLGYSNELVVQS